MNVIQLAKMQAAKECATGAARTHAQAQAKARVQHEEGELTWIGEFVDNRDTRPCKVSKGDKKPMTTQELKLFNRTPYERGFTEYIYEGWLRRMTAQDDNIDPKDPRYGIRDGSGVMRYAGGELYEGNWKMNKRSGPEGMFSTMKNYKYTGDWDNDTMHGRGFESLPCGSQIDAVFSDGVPEGLGVLLYKGPQKQPNSAEVYRYEGEFHQGHRHGKGTIFYENGDTYQGQWDFGRRTGKGITTRVVNGKEQQYETEWDQDEMISPPTCIEKARRIQKPKPKVGFSAQGNLIPADLTKWTVKEEVEDLPLEHFLRIKLGFEKLDANGTGSLSTAEVAALWGNGSQAMLQKLDADGNGTIELDEIFAAWYPNVTPHNISRFMQLDISPKVLLRLRGFLCGIEDDHRTGFLQVAGVKPIESEEDKPLLEKNLEAANYKIGYEKFTLAMYEAAKTISDPPFFLEVMETWYPNIPHEALDRYQLKEIPSEELADIKKQFFELTNNELEINIEDFENAQEKWQEKLRDSSVQFETPIEKAMREGFFRGWPFWPLGKTIKLSVQLLKDIDKFDSRIGGTITLQQLLRYTYPNVQCKKLQEALSGRRKGGNCPCVICEIV